MACIPATAIETSQRKVKLRDYLDKTISYSFVSNHPMSVVNYSMLMV